MKNLKMKYSRYKILVICANDAEYKGIYKRFTKNENSFELEIPKGQAIRFGQFCGHKMAVTKLKQQGTTRLHSIGPTLDNIFENFSFELIVMLGVCAGIRSEEKDEFEKNEKGHVLIAKEIVPYLVGKIKNGDFENRGQTFFPGNIWGAIDEMTCRIEDGFFEKQQKKNKDLKKDDAKKIHKAQIITNDLLVSDKAVKKWLRKEYPDAYGLEMEGLDLALHSINKTNNEWLLIKGVSDNAANKDGSDGQPEAINNVLDVFELILNDEGFHKYKKENFTKDVPSILISGSFDPDHADVANVEKFSFELAKAVLNHNYPLVTGYGLVVGPAVVAGAYHAIHSSGKQELTEWLHSYPFPRSKHCDIQSSLSVNKPRNREHIAEKAQYAIFIYGRERTNHNVGGMSKELEYMNYRMPKGICIPIGSTGFTAKKLWEQVKEQWEMYHPKANDNIKNLYLLLEHKKDNEAIDIVIKIIDEYEKIFNNE
ncbi:MAG: hypothetical protein FWE36_07085 [Erysipelotrichales bacterium]|nr:hypothetical protein [Erysipelotrichales bacterium]